MGIQKNNIYNISVDRPHVVLLGAGASLAAFPGGDANGYKLPLMNNFVETIPSLADYFNANKIDFHGLNFEDIYSSLCDDPKYDGIRQNVERLIYDYFSQMTLPEEPTLYDHLVLSLTGRDIIVTFNWDPFLWQAWCRNAMRLGGKKNLPSPLFLHGNTAIGVCTEHKLIGLGHRYNACPQCRKPLNDCRLLYPIKRKNYDQDSYIVKAWELLRSYLADAFMFTIFGYGAPASDVEAIDLLQKAWGDREKRRMEEIEIIDIMDENTLLERWDDFILSHHFKVHNTFYSSMIAKCSRRSCDDCFNAVVDCIFWDEHPIPRNATWDELDEWLRPYLEVENKTKA
jgi:hypothetical protein